MSTVLTLHDGPKRAGDRADAAVTTLIRIDGASGASVPTASVPSSPSVVYVEREVPAEGVAAYRKARGSGARSFVLWADDRRRERLATVTTVSAGGGVARFQVLGPHGEVIGTLGREKALRGKGLRTRWTVQPSGGPEAAGFKGRIVWWWMWWLFLPLMAAALVLTVFDSTPGNEGGFARAPRRIWWRAQGHTPFEFRSKRDELHVHAPGVDWRLGAAMIALLRSFGAGAWDASKK